MAYRRTVKGRVRHAGVPAYSSYFEERKVMDCLVNSIQSRLVYERPQAILRFSAKALGWRCVTEVARTVASLGEMDDTTFKNWIVNDIGEAKVSEADSIAILQKHILGAAKERLRKAAAGDRGRETARVEEVQKAFALSAIDAEIVVFFFLKKTNRTIDDVFDARDESIADFDRFLPFRAKGDAVLGTPRASFVKAMERTALFKSQVMERNPNGSLELSQWCADYLSGIGCQDLGGEYFSRKNEEHLAVSDFNISEDEMAVLRALLKGKKQANILFYGTPGTGKTSFVRSLAKQLNKDLFTVNLSLDDIIQERMRAVYATLNLADKGSSIVLVDEADDLLNSGRGVFHAQIASKSWINGLMDGHARKAIWITNRSAEIDPSTMRRFSFTLEFRAFDNSNRLKVLRHELAKKAVPEGFFADGDLTELCKEYSVNAAGIVNAVDATAVNRRMSKDTALRRIRTVLKNHEKAIGGRQASARERSFEHYALDGLNVSQDLNAIVQGVKRSLADGAVGGSLAMLFHGLPGTGKTEFVHYLGHVLGKEVLLKRASDIQSKWVGETEKHIAEAFQEARERTAVLFFDEADTFLFPRASASHSWEKSFTNEILTQLENHRGIAIFATNDIDGLDHAALRRFRFKVRFDPLSPAGNVRFYKALLSPLAADGGPMTADERNRLRGIGNLTPGDFAVVRSQVTLLGTDGLTHGRLLDSLENEVAYKKGSGSAIGF